MVDSWHPTDASLAEGRSGTLSCNPAEYSVVRACASDDVNPFYYTVSQETEAESYRNVRHFLFKRRGGGDMELIIIRRRRIIIIIIIYGNGHVAQWFERWNSNPKILGSIPWRGIGRVIVGCTSESIIVQTCLCLTLLRVYRTHPNLRAR